MLFLDELFFDRIHFVQVQVISARTEGRQVARDLERDGRDLLGGDAGFRTIVTAYISAGSDESCHSVRVTAELVVWQTLVQGVDRFIGSIDDRRLDSNRHVPDRYRDGRCANVEGRVTRAAGEVLVVTGVIVEDRVAPRQRPPRRTPRARSRVPPKPRVEAPPAPVPAARRGGDS